MASIRWFLGLLLVFALAVSACTSADGGSGNSSEASEELAVSSDSAPLTRDQLIDLAMALAVGENFDGEEIVVDDGLLRTLATIHIRSTAIADFLESQDEQTFDFLVGQAETGIADMVERGEINELETGSVEFEALRNIVLADRASNTLRAQTDPETGERLVGDNPFTSAFIFDPNLRANFDTVSPGFLAQFDEAFTEFTSGAAVAPTLGVWNQETFTVDAPATG